MEPEGGARSIGVDQWMTSSGCAASDAGSARPVCWELPAKVIDPGAGDKSAASHMAPATRAGEKTRPATTQGRRCPVRLLFGLKAPPWTAKLWR